MFWHAINTNRSINQSAHISISTRKSPWRCGKHTGLWHRCKQVRITTSKWYSLVNKYSWKKYKFPYPPSYDQLISTTVFLQRWLWIYVTNKSWYAIKNITDLIYTVLIKIFILYVERAIALIESFGTYIHDENWEITVDTINKMRLVDANLKENDVRYAFWAFKGHRLVKSTNRCQDYSSKKGSGRNRGNPGGRNSVRPIQGSRTKSYLSFPRPVHRYLVQDKNAQQIE